MFYQASGFPSIRSRRTRSTEFSRCLVREQVLTAADLIMPLFVHDQKSDKIPVEAMPGIARLSIDALVRRCHEIYQLGIPAVVIFPVIDETLRSDMAEEAYNAEGLVPKAIRAIKSQVPELGVISDIALDPYTSHGQDGIIDHHGYILNDETVEILVKQALCHAEAGVDVVGPSDMMDGRIGAIRQAFESAGYKNTLILSYAAKFASSLYGPFRQAVGSDKFLGAANKFTYQCDPANINEAIRDVGLDISEGADMLMVKPGLPYIDVVAVIKQQFTMPTFAYHVSGEYAMVKAAAQNQWIDERSVVMESMIAFKRAGCDGVLTYFAEQIAHWLKQD